MTYTITNVWRAKWYKRPWLWLRGKPTKTVNVYHDCKLKSLSIKIDGELIETRMDFEKES